MDHCVNRRKFLHGAALTGSAILSFSLAGNAKAMDIQGEVPWGENVADAPTPIVPGPFIYFTALEVAFLDAAVSRLVPSDELGPGAKELGVTVFLDRQMAGPYGKADRWYMQGPFEENAGPTFGYQTAHTPAQLYRAGIGAVDAYVMKSGGKTFAQLSNGEQDNLLSGLEKGEVKLEGVNGKTFFGLLLQNTIEGYLSDPIYGGNRDMTAWKLIGFPGARYDYRDWVDKHNQRFLLPPVGLKGRPEWLSQG
jgi:gluconate 2-dehydrogenase gamma chain